MYGFHVIRERQRKEGHLHIVSVDRPTHAAIQPAAKPAFVDNVQIGIDYRNAFRRVACDAGPLEKIDRSIRSAHQVVGRQEYLSVSDNRKASKQDKKKTLRKTLTRVLRARARAKNFPMPRERAGTDRTG